MRSFSGLILIGVSLLSLSAEPISTGDRAFGMSALHASRKLFLDSVAGLSEAQLNFKPVPRNGLSRRSQSTSPFPSRPSFKLPKGQ